MAQPAGTASTDKWSFFPRLNPVPRFPEYSGPYQVGTVDVEIPVSELDSPAPAPDNTAEIETVQFRVYYPCHPDSRGKRITWLPAPQRDHLSAYMQFLGVGNFMAQAVSFLPRHLYYTTIPAIKNAPVLEPETSNKRWPTAIFSHGLGGSRNAYSQFVGSLASHGVVVFCPDHRDGSPVISYVRIPSEQDRYLIRNTRRVIPYQRISHDPTEEVHELRNKQLRIRLWELGLVHDAILGMDKGSPLTNLNKTTPSLDQFVNRLHIHEPGSLIFAGHSFGAASVVQLLKSTYYSGRPELSSMASPLYTPSRDSALCRQITPRNVTILLDMWCFPLLAKSTKPLFDLPLPAYDSTGAETATPAPGGPAILAVESEHFYKWTEHLHTSARVLSPRPSAPHVEAAAFDQPGGRLPTPNFFYVQRSAHLNQSDFGVLFPWVTHKVFGSEDPEGVMRLNVRAALQVLRVNGVAVARTGRGDLGDGGEDARTGKGETDESDGDAAMREKGSVDGKSDDRAILDRSGSAGVEGWRFIDIVGMGEVADKDGKVKRDDEAVDEQESEMAGVLEPGVAEDGKGGKGALP
ncbi:Uu.00g087630.m01.CDS01 [Anthostomella pinea]|uniref:Putative phospholipase n=1 Tax=Anthostomella pinea TaxID=933095 RepID=A0AAI8YK15_9PEZI|nr:Uu.00g087630.m01.CDS01 [Anthostomella pinea]